MTVWFLQCFMLFHLINCRKPKTFGIVTNDNFKPKYKIKTRLTLYWNESEYSCNLYPTEANHLYKCNIQQIENINLFISNNENEANDNMRLELLSSHFIAFKSIIVWNENNNHYQIDRFCNAAKDECHHSLSTKSIMIHFLLNNVTQTSMNQSFEGLIDNLYHETETANNEKREQPLKRRLAVDTTSISYFAITISSLLGSGTDTNILQVVIYWDINAFSCTFNGNGDAPILDGQTIYCLTNSTEVSADPRDTNIPLNDSYKLEIEYLSYNDIDDLLRIDSITVHNKNGDYYEIDQFCVPKQFNSSNTIVSNQKCTEYPHKYLTDVVELSGKFVSAFYVEFIDGIPNNYANEAHVGKVKSREPNSFTIELTEGATYNTEAVEYTLWWDEYILHCTGKDSSSLSLYCGDQFLSNIECNDESDYKIHVFNPGAPATLESIIKIDSISVALPSDSYKIGNFCIPDSYPDVQVTGSNVGSCTNNEFNGIAKWQQVCVGDGTQECKDRSIDIRFPQNVYLFNYPNSMEGEVINAPNPVALSVSCSPTADPTDTPTIDPTNDPTTDPSIDPTDGPTTDPTNNPTTDPTTDPTNNPTTEPTFNPTYKPTVDTFAPTTPPTYKPSDSPTYKPSDSPTSELSVASTTNTLEEEISSVRVDNQFVAIFPYLVAVIVSIFILIDIMGYIDSKYCRKNDFFKIQALIAALFQVLDLLSDAFLALQMSVLIDDDSSFLILFIVSIICIVLPISLSIWQLSHEIHKHWWFDDNIKLWLTNNSKLLYFVSIFSGSSFTAIKLMNSNLLSLNIFSMGLTNAQFHRFQIKRLYSIVLLENIPQLVLQSVFLWKIDDMNEIAVSAMIFSSISIIVMIISMVTEKQILNSSSYAVVQFEIKTTKSTVLQKSYQCRNQVSKIRSRISFMLGLSNPKLIEVLKPETIPNGLKLTIHIHLNHIQSRDIDYKQLLTESQRKGELAQIIKESWNLNQVPIISPINFNVKESKNRIKKMVSIKVESIAKQFNNHLMNNNELIDSVDNIPVVEIQMEGAITKGHGEGEYSDSCNSHRVGIDDHGTTDGGITGGNVIKKENNMDDGDVIKVINQTSLK